MPELSAFTFLYTHFFDILSFLSFILAISSVFIAIDQNRKSKQSNKIVLDNIKNVIDEGNKSNDAVLSNIQNVLSKVDKSVQQLDLVSDSLSTKYIGDFPAYLPKATELLSRAKNEILMAYVIPTPGIFSAVNHWLDIKDTITKALRPGSTVKVKAVFPNEENSRAYLKEQFKDELANWEISRTHPDFSEKANNPQQSWGFD